MGNHRNMKETIRSSEYKFFIKELSCGWWTRVNLDVSVEAKLHDESRVIQRCFDYNKDDNKR